jgi:TRAP-type C4-dicarboxylate transport system permease small subunit
MTLLIALSVLLREAAGIGLSFTGELSGFMLVAVSFLGLPAAQRDGAIFRVDTLTNRMPPRAQRALFLVWDTFALVFVAILSVQLALHTYSSFTKGVASTDATRMPLWIPQAFMPVGLVLLAIALLDGMRRAARRTAKSVEAP